MSEIDILSFGETMAMFVAEQTGDLRYCKFHMCVMRVFA